jgi:hypothetical protein
VLVNGGFLEVFEVAEEGLVVLILLPPFFCFLTHCLLSGVHPKDDLEMHLPLSEVMLG